MRLHHLAAALIFLAFASAAHAKAPPRIDVLAKCKPGTACIDAEVNIDNLDTRTVGAMNDICKGPVIRVRGRLNGGRAHDYEVGFPGICVYCSDSNAAYLGQSAAGYPTFRTARGHLEILDKGVRVGAPGNLLLIDMKTGELVGKYWGNANGDSVFSYVNGRVYLLGGRTCIAATADAPRRLTVVPMRKCKTPLWRQIEKEARYDGNTSQAVDALLEKSDGSGFFRRIRGTTLWAREFGESCM